MSASIEERVVSIKFDNAKFEANVRTTLTSLENLKKSIDFSGGIKALGDLDAASRKMGSPAFDNKAFASSVQSTIDEANKLKKNVNFDGTVKALNDLDSAGKKVNLRLDPTAFQNGAKGIVDAVTTIKQNLNMESIQRGIGGLKSSVQNFSMSNVMTQVQSGIKGLADLDLAGKAVSFLPISDGAARAQQSIGAMSIAGIAAIGALGAKAALVGADMAKSMFIDPAKSGLQEYETNLGSIQTILANTQHEGATLGDVNGALDELNTYSDKTIYNFGEMARNIGTFTAAGVNLDTSTNAIKGIANLAALSGSNSEQASTAMYQLSQALAAGKVGLQDWNSVVNAGMGGKVFQDALMETARNQGKNVDGLIKQYGSFRESLQSGWITDKVLTETLSKMTGDLSDDQLKAMGYTKEQIVKIQQMAKTASNAATQIKTFSQLTGTLAESTGSGWATTWKMILGDFEEAKVMWTNVYGALGQLVQGSADARNKLLGDWKKLGGRTEMIWAVRSAFLNLMAVVTPIKEAFREVFPPTTGKQLYEITQNIRLFINALKPGNEQVSLIKNTFKLLFTILKIGLGIITGAIGVVVAFFRAFATGGDSIAGSMKPLTDFLGTVADKLKNSTAVKDFFDGLARGATVIGAAMGKVLPIIFKLVGIIGQFFYDVSGYGMYYVSRFARIIGGELIDGLSTAMDYFGAFVDILGYAADGLKGGMDVALLRITERLKSLGRLGDTVSNAWQQILIAGENLWNKLQPIRDALVNMFRDIGQNIHDVFADVNYDDTLDMINTGLLGGLFLIFRNLFKKMIGMGDGVKKSLLANLDSSVESINKVLESLSGTLEAMQQNLKADTLKKIAIAIGIMAISVIALSLVDSGKLTKALVAIGVMVVILTKAMEALDKISTGSGFLKIPFIAASMILLAIALGLLVIPVVILSKLSWVELLKGLAGVAILLFALSKATESMAKNPANLIATGVGLMAIAIAVRILADAVSIMGGLDFGTLAKGLFGVIVVLIALTKTVEAMSKNPADLIATGISLIAIAVGVKILASAVSDFGTMNIPTIIQGLIALGIVLKLLQVFTTQVGSPAEIFKTAAAMVVIGLAMKVMASAVSDFGNLPMEVLAKGLIAMAISLKAISMALAMIPKGSLASAVGIVAVAFAMKILASALKDMGGMSWEEIGKGMVTLGLSMLILGAGLILMEGTLPGAAALLVAAVAMAVLAKVLKTLGSMPIDQLLIGLGALAGIFIIFGLAGLVLSPVVPLILALGIAVGLLGLGLLGAGLGTLAFVAALIALAAVGATIGPILVTIIGSVLQLIPLAMTELGKGVVAFAGVIGNAMPVFLDAFVKLLTTLLTAVQIIFPQLMATLWMVIVGLVDLLVKAIPLFVDAGMKLVIGILNGIGNNIYQLATAAANLIANFLNGIADNIGKVIDAGVNLVVKFLEGIGNNVQRVTDAAADLIIKFVNGLASTVETKSQEMRDAGMRLAGAIIDGMTGGLATRAKEVAEGAWKMGEDAIKNIAGAIDSNSPSKETHKIGTYFGDGFINGIASMNKGVGQTAYAVGTNAVDTLKKTVSNIHSDVPNSFDITPTIKPVLDLSNVEKGSKQINGMFTTPSLTVDKSYAAVADLSKQTKAQAAADAEAKARADDKGKAGDTVIYNQNNYSPKALSSAEIYRKTNNLMSRLKKKPEVAVS